MRLCLNTQVREREAVMCEFCKPTWLWPSPAEAERCFRCGERCGNCSNHLFDIAAGLGTGLDEHNVQLFGSLLSFLNCDLPAGKEIPPHRCSTDLDGPDPVQSVTAEMILSTVCHTVSLPDLFCSRQA